VKIYEVEQAIADGKKVRRKSWPVNMFHKYRFCGDEYERTMDERFEDILANDWEIVDEAV
jgi:hypothetical protein